MKKLIAITDYGTDSLAFQEVKTAIEGFLKDPKRANISFVHSTSSTIHTAFLLYQLVLTEQRYGRPQETVFFVNTDPRIHTKEKISQAEGAKGLIIRLSSGIYVVGPNAGYCFSMIKPEIQEVYYYPELDKGSQFRSRDRYARVIAHLMDYMEDELDLEPFDSEIIPNLHGFYVTHIDNYGNIKTNITRENLKGKAEFGDEFEIKINGVKKRAKYVDNLFGTEPGILVIYPGSSGHPNNPFLEISARETFKKKIAKTGKYFFNDPYPGQKIEIF